MAERDETDARLRELHQSEQDEARQKESGRYRRNDALGIAVEIMDPAVQDPNLVLPRLVDWFSRNMGDSITPYESGPLKDALLARAQSGALGDVQKGQIEQQDKKLMEMKASRPALVTALEKMDAYDPRENGGVDAVSLNNEEMIAFAEYSTIMNQREWVLRGMGGAVSVLISQESSVVNQLKTTEKRLKRLEAREGDLEDEERKRYEGFLERGIEELKGAEARDFDRLSTTNPEDLSPVEKIQLEKLKNKIKQGLKEPDGKTVDTYAGEDFDQLYARAGTLSGRDRNLIPVIVDDMEALEKKRLFVEAQIEATAATTGGDLGWYRLYKAVSGIIDNNNVTDQWRKAWHDLGAGAQDSFTQTRWAEYQRTSDLMALMQLPQVGQAMQEAFRGMCIIGLGQGAVAGAKNVMQMERLTNKQMQEDFIEPLRRYVKEKLATYDKKVVGDKIYDLYVDFGVEMARMLFENSFCSAWCMVPRDQDGEIIYNITKKSPDGKIVLSSTNSSNPSSDEYKYGEVKGGDGSVYADRQNDYVKLAATRSKQMGEFAKGYETGLPAMIPVLPDTLAKPWVSHEEMLKIAKGEVNLLDVFSKKSENARWGWSYAIFRQAQVYDMVSKFAVGLKGFRGVADEVDFFLKSPSNLGSLAKKVDVAFGDDIIEAQRFKMNVVMTMLYSIVKNFSSPNRTSELKTVLPDALSAKGYTLVNFEQDEYTRIFVRTGFISEQAFDYIWKERMKVMLPGEGGKGGVGLIKRFERGITYKGKPVFVDTKERDVGRLDRRKALSNQV